MTLLEDNALVLFQGDSITDADRQRRNPDDLGSGYAWMVSAWFSASFPEKMVRFLNRGISGNRVRDLVKRWQRDCLDLRPTWVSILIGINDTLFQYQYFQTTALEKFETDYRKIFAATIENQGMRLILCEPFVLPYPPDRQRWREDLDPKIGVVRQLAAEFNAILIPLDEIFSHAAKRRPAAYWLSDGVHPTPAGYGLIAQAWLRAVQAMD